MRSALVLVVAVALTAPALAAALDPGALVLRRADVPSGFRLDRDQTGPRPNAVEARSDPRLPELFRRWGRVTGYQVEFDRERQTIASRVDVFRSARGARGLLLWYDREVRKELGPGLHRAPARLGQEGWIYRGTVPMPFTLVVWREGRVFSAVAGAGISRDRTLALARTQQQRVAAATR